MKKTGRNRTRERGTPGTGVSGRKSRITVIYRPHAMGQSTPLRKEREREKGIRAKERDGKEAAGTARTQPHHTARE